MTPGRVTIRRPVLSTELDTVVTGGSALLWYAVAALLWMENEAHEPWDPDYPSARPFFLLAYATGASLLLTWALRRLPAVRVQEAGRLGRILDGVPLIRVGALAAVWAALVVVAVVT
ncbi:hypothetical protein OG252_31850 [Streptomyces sp. NBC_01352]|uniref:hypothetical protein n=1 Tax=unclassified Streptomyces TaxID=2593676 RepID=UPI00225913DB|nr:MULTISPECIES: hypothetical protein [unclassified Streptomyces]MCX4700575.1 hypothetical protein [Streptomyces sp. NBC_01373]